MEAVAKTLLEETVVEARAAQQDKQDKGEGKKKQVSSGKDQPKEGIFR